MAAAGQKPKLGTLFALREFARGRECLIRVPEICRWSDAQLCHLRVANVAGGGQKPPDLCGVIGCTPCHDVIDGRKQIRGIGREQIKGWALDALVRTLALYERAGILSMRSRDEERIEEVLRDFREAGL